MPGTRVGIGRSADSAGFRMRRPPSTKDWPPMCITVSNSAIEVLQGCARHKLDRLAVSTDAAEQQAGTVSGRRSDGWRALPPRRRTKAGVGVPIEDEGDADAT